MATAAVVAGLAPHRTELAEDFASVALPLDESDSSVEEPMAAESVAVVEIDAFTEASPAPELPAVLEVEPALSSEASSTLVEILPAAAETLQVEPDLVAASKPTFVMPEPSSSPANLDSFIVTGPILPVVFQPQQTAPSPARHKAAHGPKVRAKRAWANAVVISLTGGLVATVALPAYATTNTSAITASSATQYVENIALLSKGTAAAPITRDLYAGVSADQIAALTTDDGTIGTEMTASQYLALNPDYREYEGGKDGAQDYSVWDSIDIAISEVGTSRFTGWGAPGECIVSAQRWINSAGGKFDAGGVVDGYSSSGAQKVALSDVQPGDVIQYTSTSWPNEFVVGVHTVLVIGVNADGTLDIVQSNAPAGSGLVTLVANWKPQPPEGFEPIAWRFGSIN